MKEATFQPLLQFWDRLSEEEKRFLTQQMQTIDLHLFERQRALLFHPRQVNGVIQPFTAFSYAGSQVDKEFGEALMRAGKVGCLLLAGGQGSRLRFEGPKGMYPISVIQNKSLFQLCAEKVAAASRLAGLALPLAILTSPQNDAATRAYFQERHYFGLDAKQVDFLMQQEWPLLNREGNLFLETPAKIAKGPNGNGDCFQAMLRSTVFAKWKARGIDYVQVVLIDNPLADPFDPELLGFHVRQGVEATVKCTEKVDPQEKVGILVEREGRCEVVEYTEIGEEQKHARTEDGRLAFCCANLSLFCFSMRLMEKAAAQDLPLHGAWKSARTVDEAGNTYLPKQPNAWKCETYIFDALKYASKAAALLYARALCFAPLKNLTGSDSPDTVRAALQEKDRLTLEALTGKPAPHVPFELAADFTYPSSALRTAWRGKQSQGGYITF